MKSYKIVASTTGEPVFILIASKEWSLKELNDLCRKGMNVTVVDERSDLVNKDYVDGPE